MSESAGLSASLELTWAVKRPEREAAFARLVEAAQERLESRWPSAGFAYRDNQERAVADAGEELDEDEMPAFSMSPIVCWSDGPGQSAVAAALSDLALPGGEVAGVRLAPIPLVSVSRHVSDEAVFAILLEASKLGAGSALVEWVAGEHPSWDYRSFSAPYKAAIEAVWVSQNPDKSLDAVASRHSLVQEVGVESYGESLTLARLAMELYRARPRGCEARSNWEVSNLLAWWHTGGSEVVRAANLPARV